MKMEKCCICDAQLLSRVEKMEGICSRCFIDDPVEMNKRLLVFIARYLRA